MGIRSPANAHRRVEIRGMLVKEIRSLLDNLPFDSFHKAEFSQEGDLWRFDFACNSLNAQFSATAVHKSPTEAFNAVKAQIYNQIESWHKTRFIELGISPISFDEGTKPRILLVDDDQDLAMAMTNAFDRLGWKADVVVHHEGLHTKLAEETIDYILLDWNLNGAVTADQVLEKTIRLIETFSDLQEKFRYNKPCIMTYSVLDREKIKLPADAEKYFEHLHHWQKPIPYWEVVTRATETMKAHRGVGRWADC
jgi:CheY-like chemotaxis protein